MGLALLTVLLNECFPTPLATPPDMELDFLGGLCPFQYHSPFAPPCIILIDDAVFKCTDTIDHYEFEVSPDTMDSNSFFVGHLNKEGGDWGVSSASCLTRLAYYLRSGILFLKYTRTK